MKSFIKAIHLFIALAIFLVPLYFSIEFSVNNGLWGVFVVVWLSIGWIFSIAYYSEMIEER